MSDDQSRSERGRTTLRCLLGLHRWRTRAEAGARWQECASCGRYKKQGAMANRFPPGGFGDGGGGRTW